MELTLEGKAAIAAYKYLEHRCHNIIGIKDDKIISHDPEDDCISIADIEVKAVEDGEDVFGWCKDLGLNWRREMENASFRILCDVDRKWVDKRVRFDMISIAYLGEGKAALRYHIDAVNGDD